MTNPLPAKLEEKLKALKAGGASMMDALIFMGEPMTPADFYEHGYRQCWKDMQPLVEALKYVAETPENIDCPECGPSACRRCDSLRKGR